jgi:hypothetical protein
MLTRRNLLAGITGAGIAALVPGTAAHATDHITHRWTRRRSANGWPIDPAAIGSYRIAGSAATVTINHGAPASVLLHIARRWHYEISPLDTGEGGGIAGYTTVRDIRADLESNYLSGTAIAIHPTAYPLGGSEPLWPHQEEVVRDILLDCEGTVIWAGTLTPAKASHFHLAAAPGDKTLARIATKLDTTHHARSKRLTAGSPADPATPYRHEQTRRIR